MEELAVILRAWAETVRNTPRNTASERIGHNFQGFEDFHLKPRPESGIDLTVLHVLTSV